MTEMTLQLNLDSDADNSGNDGVQFLFPAVSPANNTKSQPTTQFSLFDQDSESTFRFRFGGQQEQFNFNFVLFDDGTDRSNGTGAGSTFGSTVITLAQQIQFLRDTVYDKDSSASWTLTDGTGKFYAAAITVFVENLNIDNAPGSATVVTGQITVTRGQVLSIASIFS